MKDIAAGHVCNDFISYGNTQRGSTIKIGIVGSGSIGSNAARLFVRGGHQVALSNSRGGQGLEDLIEELGDKASRRQLQAPRSIAPRAKNRLVHYSDQRTAQ